MSSTGFLARAGHALGRLIASFGYGAPFKPVVVVCFEGAVLTNSQLAGPLEVNPTMTSSLFTDSLLASVTLSGSSLSSAAFTDSQLAADILGGSAPLSGALLVSSALAGQVAPNAQLAGAVFQSPNMILGGAFTDAKASSDVFTNVQMMGKSAEPCE